MLPLTNENVKSVNEKPGAYKIYAYRNGKPLTINRFVKIDYDGTLYIGRATKQSLRKRLYQFHTTTKSDKKTTNHSGALKYKTNRIIKDKLGVHELYFEFMANADPKGKEKELLKKYSDQFGEYPPLNK